MALLRAVARFSDRDRIAGHAGLAVADLQPSVDALVRKAGAANVAHVVALAYAWDLPSFHAPAATAAAASSREATR
jgi:hypothetical protein